MADDIVVTADDHAALDAALEGLDLIPTSGPGEAAPAAPRADQVNRPEATEGGLGDAEGEEGGDPDPLEVAARQEQVQQQPAAGAKPAADAEPEMPRGLSVKGAENWQKMRQRVGQLNKQVQDSSAKITELTTIVDQLKKQPAADPKLQEHIKLLEAELADYRTLHTTEESPAFKAKFDEPIAVNEATIYGVLKKHGMKDETIEQIKKVGGPMRLSDAYWRGQVFSIKFNDAQGQPQTWAMPMADEDAIRFALRENGRLTQQRQQALDDIPKNKEKFKEQQKAQMEAKWKAYDEQFWQTFQQFTKDTPWARHQEIPKDATPEQKAAIERDNARFAKLAPIFDAAKYPKDARTRAEVCCTVALSFVLQEDLDLAHAHIDAQNKKIEELEGKLGAIKKNGKLPPPGGPAPRTNGLRPDAGRLLDMKDEDAIDAGLDGVGIPRS